jgi:hypothetical protein
VKCSPALTLTIHSLLSGGAVGGNVIRGSITHVGPETTLAVEKWRKRTKNSEEAEGEKDEGTNCIFSQ